MSADCISITPYWVDRSEDGYHFTSDSNTEYFACFNRHKWITKCGVWEFAFECRAKKRPRLDMRVRYTIKSIIQDFWKDHTDMILFVCESLDGSQKGRKKLFRDWYDELKEDNIIRRDLDESDDGAALIAYSDNPYIEDIYAELSEIFKLFKIFKESTN